MEPITEAKAEIYPVLPLRDIVVFPSMVVPLFVGREKSVRALEEVVRREGKSLLARAHHGMPGEQGLLPGGRRTGA